MSSALFDYVLDLRLPHRKKAFVGEDNGFIERERLTLDTIDLEIRRSGRPQTVCLCTRGQGVGILTIPYLCGLLGPSVNFFGQDQFLSIYRVRRTPLLALCTVNTMELFKVTRIVHHKFISNNQ